jgi:hypothetical protein
MSEDRLEAVVQSREERLRKSEVQPFLVQPDEGTVQRIRALAERKGIDPQALAMEFMLQRLHEVEKREGMLDSTPQGEYGHDLGTTPRVAEIYTDGGCRGNPGPESEQFPI